VRKGDEVAGRYRLDDLQGHGPMSEVWRAHDDTLDRTVALKILSPTADLERFKREAQALATLADASVMRVFDYGEDEGVPFMALEWLPGGTLEDRLGQGPLPPDETRRVAREIAAGLAHLHARGLVHRDLKPANVMFDEEGRTKLADFGLARHVAGSGGPTEAGTMLGTAAYISPEQAAGEPAGPASDVYSFGVILFRLLTGALPFEADEPLALADMHRQMPPPSVESLQPAAPPELAQLAAAALRKDPAKRPADGAALLNALGAAPTAETGATQLLSRATEETRVLPRATEETRLLPATAAQSEWSRRRKAAIAAAALVLLAAGGGVLAWAITRPATPAPAGVISTPRVSHAGTTRSTQAGTPSSSQTTTAPATTAATTQATTTPTSTQSPTTAPTTTQGTTTAPTTAPTTTTATGTT
jgi:serine/threonine protein kinase